MTVHHEAAGIVVHHGDCLDVLRELPDASVDAVVTDPPYALGFMGRQWDTFGLDVGRGAQARAQRVDEVTPTGEGHSTSAGPYLASGVDSLRAAGAPYQRWCQTWAAECLRVLKPGGHMLAFGGTRTSHRLACAIEDAGFEIRDSIAWLYGCLSDDTEILTADGWVRYDRATEGQHALAFDTATGDVEWQPIQHVHRYWHDGDMVRLHSEHTDQLLTPNHRVVIDGDGRLPHVPQSVDTSDVRSVRSRVLEAERLAETDAGALLLSTMQRGTARSGVGDSRPQGERGADNRELHSSGSEDDRRAQPRLEGRRYRVQEARELCRGQVRASAGMGASDDPQGRLHHGAPATDGSHVRLPDDPAGGRQPREPRPEGQPPRQLDAVAVEPGSQAVRVGADGGRRVLPSTRVEATRVGYAGVVWCVTVATGAFIARRNGLIFATGNSGFPKSLDVGKAIDKTAGHWRGRAGAVSSSNGSMGGPNYERVGKGDPITPDAERWQGWGTALKPAHEPIVVARKPLAGTVAQTVLAHGTGALNVDGCRVGSEPTQRTRTPGDFGIVNDDGWEPTPGVNGSTAGRWPANVVLDEAAAAELDRQSGKSVSRDGGMSGTHFSAGEPGVPTPDRPRLGHTDTGGASRFFYTAKAGSAERPRQARDGAGEGRVIEGTTKVCRVCGCKTIKPPNPQPSCGHNDYERMPTAARAEHIAHPTVKPLSLMRWLVRLVTPPGGLVADPFAGSGTTAEACLLEGFRCIAVEREAEYLPLIVQRITRRRDPVAFIRGKGEDLGLFGLDEDGPTVVPDPDTRAGESSADTRYTERGGTNFAAKPGQRRP